MAGLKPGTTLKGGKYKIVKLLGQGSFGITYLATTRVALSGGLGKMEINVNVAIKEFFITDMNWRGNDGCSIEGASGVLFTDYRVKFKKEAENLAKLNHPNIVRVLEVFDENNTTYYVMQYIDGKSLDDYISNNKGIQEDKAICILKDVGSALHYMHSNKMLHLDIKPKNVMMDKSGKSYLIDFGLSKQYTEDGEPESSTTIGAGTPGYASLEQANFIREGSFPTTLDVYSLGATFYKMLTGNRPQLASDILENGLDTTALERNGVSRTTIDVVQKAMSLSRKKRYQTIEDFLSALNITVTSNTPEMPQTNTSQKIPPIVHDDEETDLSFVDEDNTGSGDSIEVAVVSSGFNGSDSKEAAMNSSPPKGRFSKHFNKVGIVVMAVVFIVLLTYLLTFSIRKNDNSSSVTTVEVPIVDEDELSNIVINEPALIKERDLLLVRLRYGEVDVNYGNVYLGFDDNPEVIDTAQLRDIIKEFIQNKENNPSYPELHPKDINLLGKCYITDKHIINFQSCSQKNDLKYRQVMDAIIAAYEELRNELAIDKFGLPYAQCSEEERLAVRSYYPVRLYQEDAHTENLLQTINHHNRMRKEETENKPDKSSKQKTANKQKPDNSRKLNEVDVNDKARSNKSLRER